MQDLKILQKTETLHEARWWESDAGRARALLSLPAALPHRRRAGGFCFIRVNQGGKLYSLGYGFAGRAANRSHREEAAQSFSSRHARFFPGHGGLQHGLLFLPELGHFEIAIRSGAFDAASRRKRSCCWRFMHGCPSIAFTYNEPTIWGEYVIDICHAARETGISTVMVTNGYITREAFHDIYDHVDAANVDLKAFTEEFYGRITLTHLQPVLDTLRWLKKETERLVRDHQPDDSHAERRLRAKSRQLAEWMLEHLGPDVPLHFTAFHPDFKLRDKPKTPPETLHAARAVAREAGLHYVYEGNIFSDGAHTYCPSCGTVLLRRSWHDVLEKRLKDGCCSNCGHAIAGRWTNPHRAVSAGTLERARRFAERRFSAVNL